VLSDARLWGEQSMATAIVRIKKELLLTGFPLLLFFSGSRPGYVLMVLAWSIAPFGRLSG